MGRHKPQRPNIVDTIAAKRSAPPIVRVNCQIEDVAAIAHALRRGGLLALPPQEMSDSAAALARVEVALAQLSAPPAPPAPATPATDPKSEPAKA